jgi:beta-galactosidase
MTAKLVRLDGSIPPRSSYFGIVDLFQNGRSLGRKKKGVYEYRLRWDDVVYQPGELNAMAYQNGMVWAESTMKTTGSAARIRLTADRKTIQADGQDLSFIPTGR